MSRDFLLAFQSEWLKRKRSFAVWLVTLGALFTPGIVIVARLIHHAQLPALYAMGGFWMTLWRNCWESMALFFLPLVAILATSLITQIEYKNNAWKQVHALPLGAATLFFSKFLVILLLVLQFIFLFNLGIYASAIVPFALVPATPYPADPLPFAVFLEQDVWYVLDCLPIVALQYLLCLRFKNFLVPIGLGFLGWIASLAALSWRLGAVVPYTYCMFDYLRDEATHKVATPPVDIHLLAATYFVLFIAAGYALFATKAEKG